MSRRTPYKMSIPPESICLPNKSDVCLFLINQLSLLYEEHKEFIDIEDKYYTDPITYLSSYLKHALALKNRRAKLQAILTWGSGLPSKLRRIVSKALASTVAITYHPTIL